MLPSSLVVYNPEVAVRYLVGTKSSFLIPADWPSDNNGRAQPVFRRVYTKVPVRLLVLT